MREGSGGCVVRYLKWSHGGSALVGCPQRRLYVRQWRSGVISVSLYLFFPFFPFFLFVVLGYLDIILTFFFSLTRVAWENGNVARHSRVFLVRGPCYKAAWRRRPSGGRERGEFYILSVDIYWFSFILRFLHLRKNILTFLTTSSRRLGVPLRWPIGGSDPSTCRPRSRLAGYPRDGGRM